MTFIDHLELSDKEMHLKELFNRYSELRIGGPFYLPTLSAFLFSAGLDHLQLNPLILQESLTEKECIPDNADTAITWHPRYLPPLYQAYSFFDVIYVWNGTCTLHIEGIDLTLKTGDFCLVAPMSLHTLSVHADDTLVCHFFLRQSTFERTFLEFPFAKDMLTTFCIQALYALNRNHLLRFRTEKDETLRSFIRYACQEASENNRYGNRMLNHLIRAIFILILRNYEEAAELPVPPDKPADRNLIAILHHLRSNYAHITLPELAQAFNYSERHMSRILKEQVGMNFHDILRKFRIEKAAELLSHPDIPMSDIVEQTGYSDLSSLSRVFRGRYGISPQQYRAAYSSGQMPSK